MGRVRTFAVTFALAIALAITTGSASAATGQGRWMPQFEITTESAVNPRVAINATGEGLAVWGARTPEITKPVGPVSASVRPPGGQFGAPKAITPGTAVNFVGMAANSAGDATVLFWNGSTYSTVFRKGLGEFGPPAEIEANWGQQAIDEVGNTTIVSTVQDRDPQTGRTLQHRLLAYTRAADGTMSAPRLVASAQEIYGASVAAGPGGELLVAWAERGDERDPLTRPMIATAPLAGDFSAPAPLDEPSRNIQAPRVVTNVRGDALVAWGVQNTDNVYVGNHVIHSRLRPLGGEFGPAEEVLVDDEKGRGLYRWDVALSNTGDAVAAWQTAAIVVYSFKPAGRPWEPARPARGTYPICCAEETFESQNEPTVTFDGKGTATIAYTMGLARRQSNGSYKGDGGTRLMAMRRPAAGAWEPREQVATAKHIFAPDSAADPLGNTILVWSHEELNAWEPSRTETGIGSVVWDASAPSVKNFGVDPAVPLPQGEQPAFEYKLSEAAAVAVTVERKARKPVRLAKLSFRSPRGNGVRAIDPQLAKRLRKKGSFRATIVARDSQGRKSKPRRIEFSSLRGAERRSQARRRSSTGTVRGSA